ncbi:formyl-CoA transferase [Antricoccus suffuscus]|uniref:Formyl-CoA transferase n=1 Tax=Antricoccus suffuscus TaxID=1629062 RepID=A0A2T1A6E2_9ACTN|nr:CoA transferase [Antricoccus suffuscus]PRZ44124.1 formyl-CoA transferase [Antricoccus suffuscus]
MTLALEGIRVLELGQIYNGPYCGLLLAQLGADVIKVEPRDGERLRFRSTEAAETHEFLMLNSNKRSVAVNLKSAGGKAAIRKLAANVDVIIENFGPGTMDRLDLAPQDLLELNPRLVYASGKGYGSTGPYAHMMAMDITVQAMSGAISSTGMPDGPPMKAGPAFIDFSGGIHLYAAIMTALYQRERTGRGQLVEVSMHDTVYPMLASSLGAIHNDPERVLPERTGNRHSGLAVSPYNVYPTQDGWLAIISISDRHFKGVLECASRADLHDDPRFANQKSRARNMDALDAELEKWTRLRTRDELAAQLQAHGVPCAPVRTVREVDQDPHLIERGMIRYVEHPDKGRVPVPGSPLHLADSPVGPLTVAPRLGEATDEVMADLCGYTAEEISELRATGAIS